MGSVQGQSVGQLEASFNSSLDTHSCFIALYEDLKTRVLYS